MGKSVPAAPAPAVPEQMGSHHLSLSAGCEKAMLWQKCINKKTSQLAPEDLCHVLWDFPGWEIIVFFYRRVVHICKFTYTCSVSIDLSVPSPQRH